MAYSAPRQMNLGVNFSPASPQTPMVPPTDPRMGKPTNGLALAPQVAQMPATAPQQPQAAPMRPAAPSAPATPTNPAQAPLSTNGLVAMAPKPRQAPGPLRGLAQSFARGMSPEGYAEGQKGAQDERMAQLAEMQQKAKASLIWMQQTAAQPTPQARAAFTLQNAQAIAQATGQPVEAVMQSATDPNAFSDQALQQGMASFSALAGIGPEKPAGPDYQFLQGPNGQIARGDKTSGGFEVMQEGSPDANGARLQRAVGKNGNYWTFDPATGEMKDTGIPAPERSSASGSSKSFRWASPEEVSAAGLPDGTSMQINTETGEGVIKSRPRQAAEYDPATLRKYMEQAKTLDSLDGAVGEYERLVQQYGPQLIANPGDPKVAELQAAHTNVLIQMKELFNLGVLNGPDLDIIERAVPPPAGLGTFMANKGSMKAKLGVVHNYIDRGRKQIPEDIVSKARPNGAPNGQPGKSGQHLIPSARPQQQTQPQQAAPDDMDAHIDSLFGDLGDGNTGGVPDGIDPADWEYLTPQEQQDYLAGSN